MKNINRIMNDSIMAQSAELLSSNEKESTHYYSGVGILTLAFIGIVVNLLGIIILIKKRNPSMFHALLKILITSDLVVVFGCILIWGIPNSEMWEYYELFVFPIIVPYILTITQIAMMISVYCTTIMSFERYTRIGKRCQMKDCSYITNENLKYYIIGLLVLPVIFYMPRFFERQIVYYSYDMSINCRYELLQMIPCQINSKDTDDRVMPPLLCKKPTLELTTKIHIRYGFALIQKDIHNKTTQEFLALDKLLEMKSNKWNSMIKRSGNSTESIEKTIRMIREANYRTTMVVLAQAARIPKATPSEMLTGPNYKQIQSPTCANNKTKLFAGMLMFNHTDPYPTVEPSSLWNNKWYFTIYVMVLTSLFGNIIPLFLLVYLNVYTISALMNLGRETKNAVSSRSRIGGSACSTRSLTKKLDKKERNKTKANMKTVTHSERSNINKPINKLVKFVTSPYSRSRETCEQENKISDRSCEQKKNSFKNLSSIDSIEKIGEGQNSEKGHYNTHNQKILNKRSHSLDCKEDILPCVALGNKTRRQSCAISNEVSYLSSNVKRFKPKMDALDRRTASKRVCVQHVGKNADDNHQNLCNDENLPRRYERAQSNTRGSRHNVNVNDRLLPLHQLCRNTFESAVSSPSNPSNSNELSEETFEAIFHSSKATQINGNARLSMHRTHREFHVEETMLDNEDVKRRMSVISTNIEYTFKGIRKKLNTFSESKSVEDRYNERSQHFEEAHELEQCVNSSSEENTTEEENHSEIIKVMPDYASNGNNPQLRCRTRFSHNEFQHDARLILLRTKEARLTRIALGIVSLYLLCHIWRLVPTIYELIYGSEDFPNWIEHMTGFSHNMIVLNSAINFLLYLVL